MKTKYQQMCENHAYASLKMNRLEKEEILNTFEANRHDVVKTAEVLGMFIKDLKSKLMLYDRQENK